MVSKNRISLIIVSHLTCRAKDVDVTGAGSTEGRVCDLSTWVRAQVLQSDGPDEDTKLSSNLNRNRCLPSLYNASQLRTLAPEKEKFRTLARHILYVSSFDWRHSYLRRSRHGSRFIKFEWSSAFSWSRGAHGGRNARPGVAPPAGAGAGRPRLRGSSKLGAGARLVASASGLARRHLQPSGLARSRLLRCCMYAVVPLVLVCPPVSTLLP